MLHHFIYDDYILDPLLEPNTAALLSTFHILPFSRLCLINFFFCFSQKSKEVQQNENDTSGGYSASPCVCLINQNIANECL